MITPFTLEWAVLQAVAVTAVVFFAHVLTSSPGRDGGWLRGRRSAHLPLDQKLGSGTTVGLVAVCASLPFLLSWFALLALDLGVDLPEWAGLWPAQFVGILVNWLPSAIGLNVLAGTRGGLGRAFGFAGGFFLVVPLLMALSGMASYPTI